MASNDKPARGPFLTTIAILFTVLAISNWTKAFQHMLDPKTLGIVIFGFRFESVVANLLLGPIMGTVIGLYAYGLWTLRSWVKPLSIGYAFYVPANLVLFWWAHVEPEKPPLIGILVYLMFAFTGSIGTALYLAYHPDKLGRRE